MVTGHLATAYLARARAPRAELFALLVASILPDLADFVLPQGNQCRTWCGMYTHAMPAVFVLAGVAAVLAWFIWHRRATAFLAGGLVLLHVTFDLVTGHKPYWIGGPALGLGLYQHPAADFAVEVVLVLVAWTTFRRREHTPRHARSWAALALLLAMQAAFDVWMYRQVNAW